MTHIEQRADTAAGWASANPILLENEVGWETNTRKGKIGDGFTHWNDLLYLVGVLPTSVALTGTPTAPTPAPGDNDTSIATTAFVQNEGFARTASPSFTGDPKAPTPASGDDDTSLATTHFVRREFAPLDSPVLTGNPTAPTAAGTDNDTTIATTAMVQAALKIINPVGRILFSADNVNPGTYIPGTTWVAFGSGRMPVGVDTTQAEFDTPGETGGAKTVTLTANNLPPHVHAAGTNRQFMVNDSTAGTNRANGSDVNMVGQSNTGNNVTTTDPVNNLPPYITCYMWKRTA